jgi:hypothetical protein
VAFGLIPPKKRGWTVPRISVALLVVLVLGALQASALSAQQVQLRPHAGLYLPSRVSIQRGVLHVRQRIGVTLGARLTLTFSERFDVITGVTYIPGYATFRGAGKRIDVGTGSHRLTATSGARYWLLPPVRKLTWEVHTGLGVAFGGLPAYQDLFESSTVSGILGTTMRYQIGRIVTLKLRVQERLYRVRFRGADPGSSSPPLHISFGVELPIVESAP